MDMRTSRSVLAFVVAVLIVIAAYVAISMSAPQSPSLPQTTQSTTPSSSVTSVSATRSPGPSGPFMNLSQVYVDLGYPNVTYSQSSPYLPSRPNVTLEYQTKDVNYQLGVLQTPVINLTRALESVSDSGALLNGTNNSSSGFALVSADFEPGQVVNSALEAPPTWDLSFARVYDGYWVFGEYGVGDSSAFVSVDALNGTVIKTSVEPAADTPAPASGTKFDLNVNESQALQVIRGITPTQGVPQDLTRNGTVSLIQPMIVLFGPSSKNEAFQTPLDPSLSGQERLCWVVEMSSPTPGAGYQGRFAVDAETGTLDSEWAQALYPSTAEYYITGSAVLPSSSSPSPNNLTMSQETFQINGSVVGRPGLVPVVVPNVLIMKPGSSAMVGLNFTSTFAVENVTVSPQSFSNPLPGFQNLSSDGLPAGVSAQFLTASVVVPANGNGIATISISANESAPSGTYLLKLNAAWSNIAGGQSSVAFLLTIWDGTGQWPPPPTVN